MWDITKSTLRGAVVILSIVLAGWIMSQFPSVALMFAYTLMAVLFLAFSFILGLLISPNDPDL
jgi:hypothetical protein